MKKIVRLTESDLTRLVNRVIQEQEYPGYKPEWDEYKPGEDDDAGTKLAKMKREIDDKDYGLYKMKKAWASSIMKSKTEEELMDNVLILADFATYRKTKPFK